MLYSVEPINGHYRDFVEKQVVKNWAGPFIVTRGVLYEGSNG